MQSTSTTDLETKREGRATVADRSAPALEPLDPSARYYAVYYDESREEVIGIRRRRPLGPPDMQGVTEDEAFTTDLRWESTLFFINPLFGKGDDEPYSEIGLDEAERLVKRLYDDRLPRWQERHP